MVTHNCHGKTKNLTAKTKYLAAKTKTSRQNQMLHGKSKIAFNWFCRGYWLWPWGICMVFAVYLVLPWGLWFCREVFGFVVSYFVFAVRFLVLPWKLWATVPFVPESYYRGEYQISISPAILQRWSETIWSTSTPLQPCFWLFIPWLGAFL